MAVTQTKKTKKRVGAYKSSNHEKVLAGGIRLSQKVQAGGKPVGLKRFGRV